MMREVLILLSLLIESVREKMRVKTCHTNNGSCTRENSSKI